MKVTGDEGAYVAARIVITNDNAENGVTPSTTPITDVIDASNVLTLFQGGMIEAAEGITLSATVDTANDCVTVYLILSAEMTEGDTAVFFENFVIPAAWNNAQMQACNGLEVVVEAYAVQSVGFENTTAVEAIKTAFPSVFSEVA